MNKGDGLPRGGKQVKEPLLATGGVVPNAVDVRAQAQQLAEEVTQGCRFGDLDDDQGGPPVIRSR